MSRKDRKRVNPIEESRKWSEKNIDPPGFNRSLFENKGRGVRTTGRRNAGDFLLVYTGKVITTKEGENLEEGSHLATDFVYRDLCVDASEEDGRLGRLVTMGARGDQLQNEINRGSAMSFWNQDLTFSVSNLTASSADLMEPTTKANVLQSQCYVIEFMT
nr:N-lysine methyltransferase KMT5A-like [Crassostrea gigas]